LLRLKLPPAIFGSYI